MEQTAKIINFERHAVKADISDGYYRLANALSDTLCCTSFSDRESRVIRAIERLTFGYNCKYRLVHNDEIALKTNICPTNISKTIKPLLERRILVKNHAGEIGFNTFIEEWQKSKPTNEKSVEKSIPTSQNRLKSESKPTLNKVDIDLSDESKPTSSIYKALKTKSKDNLKDNSKNNKLDVKSEILDLEIPVFLSHDLWTQLVEHRLEIKKPYSLRSAKMAIAQLDGWHAEGHNTTQIIMNCIANGYQGLFAPNNKPNGNTSSGYMTSQDRITSRNQQVMEDFIKGKTHE